MKKNLLRIISLIACLSTAACLFAGCKKEEEKKQEVVPSNQITIGLSTPLSGEEAGFGTAIKNAAQMAVDEINASAKEGDLILKLVALDDKNDPNAVSSTYSSMKQSGVQVSLGATSSATGLKFAEFSKADNMFFLTPSASADEVVKYDNAYQMCISDNNKDEGTNAGKYFYGRSSSIGILYQSDDSYSTRVYNDFKAYYDKTNAAREEEGYKYKEYSFVEASFTSSTTQFTEQIELLKNCDCIFMPINYTAASRFMTQAVGTISSNTIYYGGNLLNGISTQKDVLDSIHNPIEYFSTLDSNGVSTEFINKYTKAYGRAALSDAAICAYDSVKAIYEAMSKAVSEGAKISSSTTPSELCEILKAQFNGNFEYIPNKEDINTETEMVTVTKLSWDQSGLVSGKKLSGFSTVREIKTLVPNRMEASVWQEKVVDIIEANITKEDQRYFRALTMKVINIIEPKPGQELGHSATLINQDRLAKYPQLQRVKEDGTVENITLVVSEHFMRKELILLEGLIIKYCPDFTYEFLENYYREINYDPFPFYPNI